MNEKDYRGRVRGHGGSKKGRDVRHWPKEVKLFIYKWALKNIGGGSESTFLNSPDAGGRWSTKNFEPCVEAIREKFPEEAEKLFSGREERAANCVMNRHHKMYYEYRNGVKCRCISSEHPRNWDE